MEIRHGLMPPVLPLVATQTIFFGPRASKPRHNFRTVGG
jgi:hypothetical protein